MTKKFVMAILHWKQGLLCDNYMYTNGQKSCPVHKILNISFFNQTTKRNQVSLERTIQDTFIDIALKEFGSVPSMPNPHKVGHYKL